MEGARGARVSAEGERASSIGAQSSPVGRLYGNFSASSGTASAQRHAEHRSANKDDDPRA